MSEEGDWQHNLEKIYDMMPLSEREYELAEIIVFGNGQVSIYNEVRNDPKWWGEKCIKVVNEFVDYDEQEWLDQAMEILDKNE